jgi:uncharacterized protein
MKMETIEKLCCPFDKSDLKLHAVTKDEDGNIVQGLLSCQGCKRTFPIVYGIPIMTPDEYRAFDLERPLVEKMKKELHEKM